MLSMSQEIIQEKKDMLEAHLSTILAVPISHQLMKYLLVAQTSESHELWEVRISEDPWSELIVWSSNVKMSEFHGMSRILEA